eukprot:3766081-Alexandrium_andersonii.AAC.1
MMVRLGLAGERIGEAKRPGPTSSECDAGGVQCFRFETINVTALQGHLADISEQLVSGPEAPHA